MQLSRNLAPTAIYVPLFVLPEAEVYNLKEIKHLLSSNVIGQPWCKFQQLVLQFNRLSKVASMNSEKRKGYSL